MRNGTRPSIDSVDHDDEVVPRLGRGDGHVHAAGVGDRGVALAAAGDEAEPPQNLHPPPVRGAKP